jgi:hypothetical protein
MEDAINLVLKVYYWGEKPNRPAGRLSPDLIRRLGEDAAPPGVCTMQRKAHGEPW